MLRSEPSHVMQTAVATFRPRQEDVIACESVTLSAKKEKKQRVLALCVPSDTSTMSLAEGAVLYVTQEERGLLKPKLTLRISRLADIDHAGMFDCNFDFAGSTVEVTFESHLQREMFVAALKRVQRDLKSGGTNRGGEVNAFLTESVEAAANADAAARVQRLRQEKRRAFSRDEEEGIIGLIRQGRCTFDDIQHLERTLATQAKQAELQAARDVMQSHEAWSAVREEVEGLNEAVKAVQDRIRTYSDNLLSKKSLIQKIEFQNNLLHRTHQNVKQLSDVLQELHSRLSLDDATLGLLQRLSREQNTLVEFFSDRNRARTVAKAMKHMESVLHDEDLRKDFAGLVVVEEQRKRFLSHRKMIVGKVTLYALAVIEIYKVFYLTNDRSRFSSRGRVVWRCHKDVMEKLEDVQEILSALERIDMEGYAAVLRKYRVAMQQVYTLELRRYFTEIKVQTKKVGFDGPSLLGHRDTADASLKHIIETGMMGETPAAAGGLSSTARSANYFTSPMRSITEDFSSRLRGVDTPSYRCGTDSFPQGADARVSLRRGASDDGEKDTGAALFIDLAELNMCKQRLQRPGQLTNMTLHPASTASVITSRVNPEGAGSIRPDIAFAMTLEAVMDCILREEVVLGSCFGLKFEPPPQTEADDSTAVMSPAGGGKDSERRQSEQERMTRNELLDVSLKELFAGDATVNLDDAKKNRGASPPQPKKRQSRRVTQDDDDDDAENSDGESTDSEEEERLAQEERQRERRNYIKFEMMEFTAFLIHQCDRVYTIPMLCMVRGLRRPQMLSAKSPYCADILQSVDRMLTTGLARFVSEQTESIERCGRKWMLRPHALLHCFAKLPALLRRLEATQNSLSPELLDQTDYASTVMSFVDQAFEWLDVISHIRPPTARESADSVITVADLLTEKAREVIGIAHKDAIDPRAIRRGHLVQYRHHAFFCAMLQTFPQAAFCRELLAERMTSSLTKRERYEELYLTRLIMIDHLPVFTHFMLTAEDLIRTYSMDELTHHRAVSVDAVRRVLLTLEPEAQSGVRDAAARIKKHFTRDVRANTPEEGFHKALLHSTWSHFAELLVNKYASLERMVATWPHLQEARNASGDAKLVITFGAASVRVLLEEVKRGDVGKYVSQAAKKKKDAHSDDDDE